MSMSTKRSLTKDEIQSICNRITLNKSIPIETAECVRGGLIRSIRGQLEAIQIYPEAIPELTRLIEEEYHISQLQPGEMVGVQAATSIGEPVSQMTLNAFHFSGISSIGIASGVPRVEEILNASKKQKSYSMTLYFKQQEEIRQLRRKLFSSVIEVYLSNIIQFTTVEYVSSLSDFSELDQSWYQLYFMLYHNDVMNESNQTMIYPWRIRLELYRSKMYQHSITCIEVAKKIEETYRDLYCVPSPDNIGVIDVYVDFRHMKLKKKEEEELESILHRDFLCVQNIILPMLNDILISGISGIEDIFMREEKGEWVVDTKGTNLSNIFQHDFLDHSRCHSSDIWEVCKTFGIEATRQFIITEFYKVLSASGASVGRRHIELLADSMTFQGRISSVNRYGIDRNETGPLAKASFEESVSNFFIAAANGEKDEMGVSSSVMAGKMAQFGTGYIEIINDDRKLIYQNIALPDPYEEKLKLQRKPKPVEPFKPFPNIKPLFPIRTVDRVTPVHTPKPFNPLSLKKEMAPASFINPNMKGMERMVGIVQEHINPMFRLSEKDIQPMLAPKKEFPVEIEQHKISWVKKKPATVKVVFEDDD